MNVSKVKRQPLLFDEFMACKPKLEQEVKAFSFLRGRMADAKVFAMDEDAAKYAAHMIHDHPEAIAHDQEFAIPPFKKMFIELPYPEFFKIMGGVPRNDGTEDRRIGYFYDGPRVYVLAAGTVEHRYAAAVPLRYKLNEMFEFAEETKLASMCGTSRLGLDSYFWGSCAEKVNQLGLLRTLRANHSCEFWFAQEWFDDFGEISDKQVRHNVARVMTSSAGDLRNIIALPLFLNRVREVIYEEDIPPAPSFVYAKPRTLTRHSVVHVRLDPAPLLQKIYSGPHGHIWRREHDVRGHFCHNKMWRDHDHDHQPTEYDVNQWRCMLCGGLKWWKKEHRRGKQEVGKVKTTYEVSAARQ
jgi:hypothetical protein